MSLCTVSRHMWRDTVAECIIFYYLSFLSPLSLRLLSWTKEVQLSHLLHRKAMDEMKASGHPYTTKPISHLFHRKAMDKR
jgi:hypothetical protein